MIILQCNITNEVLIDHGHCINKCLLGTYKYEKQTNIYLSCPIGCQSCINQIICY